MFKRKDYKEKQLRYSIRKVSFGAASVAIASLYLFMGSSAVSASEVQFVNGEQNTVTNKEEVKKNEKQTEATDIKKGETLDKTSLTKLIEEIDGKFTNGKYTSKTEDSVNQLKAALEAAKTALSTAKTQAELTQAHANLIVATTKLQTKSEDKKEAPAVATTNGKATVGIKATNTEKASESNSIANSGSKDERNGKEMDKNNPLRTGEAPSTTDDTSANQVFDNPAEGADLTTLSNKLKSLPEAIQNNTKIQDMNDLGDKTGVARGEVKEINEFGGWKAINQPDGTAGKFAIARKTESGVFPVETVNTVYNDGAKSYDTYVGEQAFDRTKDYMLFLGKVRTIASEKEETFNGQPYKRTGLGGSDSFGIKSFNGIEKTFKAHSPATGSKVKVSFKTGFTGDLNGTKAKYLVEVVYRQNGSEVTAYTYTFAPQPSGTVKNEKGIVTQAKDGTGKSYIRSNFNNYNLNKAEVEAKMAEDANKPNGQAGTFTSSDIDLPVGVTEYTVRIKVTDTEKMGMGYQSPLRHYALPVTGTDFSIEQDTKNVAKDLLQRIYNKLIEQKSEDTKWSTPETKAAYETKLNEINNLLSSEISTTSNYKDSAKSLIEKYNSLNNSDTIVAAAKADLAEAAKAEKAEIAADKSLTEAQRTEKEKAVDTKKAEEEAKITAAENADKVAEAKTAGETAIKGVHTPGNLDTVKEAAIKAINAEKAAKEQEIDNNTKLSDDEKAAAKAEVAKAATEAVEAIKNADTKDAVKAAKTNGEAAIKAVTPVGKEKALEAIQTAAEAKLAEIDKNDKLSAKEKAAAKAEVAKAAIEAVEAIQKATTQEAVNAAQVKGETAIKVVNPIGKEKALEAIQTAAEAKLAEIDKNTNLSEKEKAAAKAEVAKAAIEAVEAIQKAETQDAVDAAQVKGETAIKAVNPIGKEKALEAIKATKEAKLAEIEKDTTLSAEEKAAAKAAIEKAYNEAVEAIQKAETQEEVNAAQLKGEAAIKAVNTIGKEDVNEAKEAVKAATAEKIASIKANPNLSTEEKEKAIAEVERLKQAALDAIDKATTKAALDKALRTFLYQLDRESLVYERPTFNLEAYIQASITGVVKVELGKAITQAEVISKLNLPENVTIISVDLPDTNTLGRKFAKVILRLPDGTEATVFVPVEVVESSEEYNQQNRQPNNTPVKPQEDAKPAEVSSDNSEQPAVNQTEDVKGNSSTTSQESKASNQKVLPNTGTGNEISIFGSAAMTVLASLGLVATSKKKEEE